MKMAIAIASTIFLLAGCAPVDSVTKRNTIGQPQAYQDGFRDGCGSGYVAAGHPYARPAKDINKFLGDQVYKVGWDDGFTTCKGQYDSIGQALKR